MNQQYKSVQVCASLSASAVQVSAGLCNSKSVVSASVSADLGTFKSVVSASLQVCANLSQGGMHRQERYY